MATATFYPTGNSNPGSFSDPTRIYASDGSYASKALNKGENATLTGTTFKSSGSAPSAVIPAGSTINSVTFYAKWYWSSYTGPYTFTLRLTVGSDVYSDTSKPTSGTERSLSYTGASDLSTLDAISAAFYAAISYGTSTCSGTANIDYIKMVVEYTESTPVTVNVGNAAGATAAAPTPSVSGAASVSAGNAAAATAAALVPSVSGAAVVTVGNAAAATAAAGVPSVLGAATVTVDNAAAAVAAALIPVVTAIADISISVDNAASASAAALVPTPAVSITAAVAQATAQALVASVITDAILSVENAAVANASASIPVPSGGATVTATAATATAQAYEVAVSGGATVTADNAAAATAEALTHGVVADANISVGNAASALALAKDAIISTGWSVLAVPATATAAGVSDAIVTGTAVVTAGNAAAATAAGVGGATITTEAIISPPAARATAAGISGHEIIEGYLLKIINVGNAAAAVAAALVPNIVHATGPLKAIKKPNYAHVDPAARNATDELIKNIQTYASGNYLKLGEKARPTGLASLDDNALVVQEPASKGQASGIASLDGSSLVVQNPASATATPTASKIPIAESSGKMAVGWIPRIPMSFTIYAAGTATALGWGNMPAALTELCGNTYRRFYVDLTYATQARIHVYCYAAGSADAKIRLQYSLDDGSTWDYMDGVSGPSVSIASTGLKLSSWVDLAAAAKAPAMLRFAGIDGDGVADPEFIQLIAQFQ